MLLFLLLSLLLLLIFLLLLLLFLLLLLLLLHCLFGDPSEFMYVNGFRQHSHGKVLLCMLADRVVKGATSWPKPVWVWKII